MKLFLPRKQNKKKQNKTKQKEKKKEKGSKKNKAIITIILSAFHDLACKICFHKTIHYGNISVRKLMQEH